MKAFLDTVCLLELRLETSLEMLVLNEIQLNQPPGV